MDQDSEVDKHREIESAESFSSSHQFLRPQRTSCKDKAMLITLVLISICLMAWTLFLIKSTGDSITQNTKEIGQLKKKQTAEKQTVHSNIYESLNFMNTRINTLEQLQTKLSDSIKQIAKSKQIEPKSQAPPQQESQESQPPIVPLVPQIPAPFPVDKRDLRIPPGEDFTHLYCIKKGVKNPIPQNGQRQVLVDTNYGFPLYIDTGGIKVGMFNSVAYFITMYGTWQPQNIFAMGLLIRPGFKILNVGAQFGLECIALAKIAGPTGKLVMFEPYSYSYNNLVKSIKINNLTNTTQVHKLAVSDKAGTGQINVYEHNTGMSQINNPSFGGQQKEDIQIVTLDTFLPQNTTFDFVLIDAERYEIETILSMKQIIKRSPYMVILTEWSWNEKDPKSKNKKKADEMIAFLKSRKYKIYQTQGFNANSCVKGRANPIEDWDFLFRTPFTDILLVPESVILPY